MKFTIVVQGAPGSHQAGWSALHFARAVIRGGHEIYRIFFYQDGVFNGNALIAAPPDEPNITAAWSDFGGEHKLELAVCIASSLRRGVLDETEAARYEKPAANLAPGFNIVGLGQLIDACLNADKIITFGP